VHLSSNIVYRTPHFIFLHQLPISKDVLIKSRFIIYFIYSIPFHTLLLTSIYFWSPSLKEILPLSNFIVFLLVWIAFIVWFGGAFPAGDVGDQISKTKLIKASILLYGGTALVFAFFYLILDQGIVNWTIAMSNRWPLVTLIVSIMVAFLSLWYWIRYADKRMTEVDYLD